MLHLFLIPSFKNIRNCCPQRLFSSLEVWQIVSIYISSYKSNFVSLPSSYIIFSKQTLLIPMPPYFALYFALTSIININHNFIIHKRNILDPPKLLPFLFSSCFSTPLIDTLPPPTSIWSLHSTKVFKCTQRFHHHHHHNKDKQMCTTIILLNMTKLQ
jgi:hypothetical protein